MILRRTLTLAFSSVALLMGLAAGWSLWRLNAVINAFETQVATAERAQVEVLLLAVDFKTQVQEWKNVILRGSKPDQLTAYWQAFERQEASVRQQTQTLVTLLGAQSEAGTLMVRFGQAHDELARGYRVGRQSFEAANFDHTQGDRAVKGIDREPLRLLEQAVKVIAAQANAARLDAKQAAQTASRLTLLALLAAMGVAMALAAWVSRQVLRQLGGEPMLAQSVMLDVAHGDLRHHNDLDTAPAGSLMAALEAMRTDLADLAHAVRDGADAVSQSANEIALGNEDLSNRTQDQSSNLARSASSMQVLALAVQSNADSAQRANHLALEASAVAQQGGVVVGDVVGTMQRMSAASQRIESIIGTIDGIAFQTNILALNAAVEAARAGESGRGFAVVASEVRALAQRSAAAAKEIKTLIDETVQQVDTGTAQVDQARQTMQQVVDAIGQVTEIMAGISAESAEQAMSVGQIGAIVRQLGTTTHDNAALVEQMAAAAENLNGQAQELTQVTQRFVLDSN